jgi:lipopolysaccharide/colanic/teichoic acid biosynthesis glycosyltransferase
MFIINPNKNNINSIDAMDEKINLLYIGSNKEVVDQMAGDNRIMLSISQSIEFENFSGNNNRCVVLCDQLLPGCDGFKVYHQLRSSGQLNHIPFILFAPEHSEGLLISARKLGIDDVFVLQLPRTEDFINRLVFLIEYRQKNHSGRPDYFLPEGYNIPLSKRLFDIIVASTALILLSPVLLLVMVAIRIESKGKVYYTSTRVGRKPFDFYKFRSMRPGAEDELNKLALNKNQYITHQPVEEADWKKPCPCSMKGDFAYCSPVLHSATHSVCDTWYIAQKRNAEKAKPHFIKIENDPRVTRVGKIIRNTSIDELPQLVNVIKGDMSIVGNRPLPIYEAEKLTSDAMAKRFLAPAGLTGLWQVEKRGRKGSMSDEERKRLDNQYAELFINKKYSFFYDIKLILRTIPVIIQKESV